MAHLVAGSAFNMDDLLLNGSTSEFFEFGTVTTGTGTTLIVEYADSTIAEELRLTGTFGDYVDGYPTTGTISSLSYTVNGAVLFTVTDIAISVEDFTAFAIADDLQGLFAVLLGGDDELSGSSGGDVLLGFDGNDVLDGGAGADVLQGGLGDDTYFVDDDRDLTWESAGEGTDTVVASLGWSIYYDGDIENLTVTGSADARVMGNDAANVLTGNSGDNNIGGYAGDDRLYAGAGNDQLDGGTGSDRMYGGSGDDTYFVDDEPDRPFESAGEGTDTVLATVNHTLGANVENLILGEYGDLCGTGNDLDNIIVGNILSNRLFGRGGDDRLEAGGGLDRLYGGTGNDTYVVNDSEDYVYEFVGEGYDRVLSSGTHVLRNNVEELTLTGTGSVRGFGNAQANTLIGNSGANRLYGRDGDDRLHGGEGNDRLYGEAGVDKLYGGLGDDIYMVRDSTDYAYEYAGEGYDRVYSTVTHVLRANIEELRLQGAEAIDGHGSSGANLIYGNVAANKLNGWGGDDKLFGDDGSDRLYGSDGDDRLFGEEGNDRLDGGAGYDRLYGGAGDDIYIVRDSTDFANELAGEGMDTVYSSVTHELGANVETLRLTGADAIDGFGNAGDDTIVGNSAANQLYGESGADRLFGGSGDDVLYGGSGDDLLEGGAGTDHYAGGEGADRFVFREGDFGGTTFVTGDIIHDFSQADGDRVRLDLADADATLDGDQDFAFLGTGSFTGTAGELRYYQNNGYTFVIGDTDGDGISDFLLRLDGLQTLTSDDFIL